MPKPGLAFDYSFAAGAFDKAMTAIYGPIAAASTAAITRAATNFKRDGRANIAAADFSKRWQNALAADIFPRRGVSVDAAALLRHKILYAGVFEQGATIRGKPTLWVPLSTTPKKIGQTRMTPKLYEQRIGPLLTLPGHPNLLFGRMEGKSRRATSRVTVGRLVGRHDHPKSSQLVPLFFGVPAVTLRKRFGLLAIAAREAANLPTYYNEAFKG